MIKIEAYSNIQFNENWKTKIIQQLNKDLMLCGFDHQFQSSITIENFFKESITFFEHLLLENESQLFNLLYRIDVPQELIHVNNGSPQINITKAILNREFQKVVLKSQYS